MAKQSLKEQIRAEAVRRITTAAEGLAQIGRWNRLADQVGELEVLLTVARCPNCDGSGAVPVQVAEDHWEADQCQWCDERDKALGSGGSADAEGAVADPMSAPGAVSLQAGAKRARPERASSNPRSRYLLHVASATDERLDAWVAGELALSPVDPELEQWIDELVTGVQRNRANVKELIGWVEAACRLKKAFPVAPPEGTEAPSPPEGADDE